MMEQDAETTVGKVEVKDGVELRVSTKSFKGRPYLSARIWERYGKGDAVGPTKKGFTVAADLAPEIAALIAKAGKGAGHE